MGKDPARKVNFEENNGAGADRSELHRRQFNALTRWHCDNFLGLVDMLRDKGVIDSPMPDAAPNTLRLRHILFGVMTSLMDVVSRFFLSAIGASRPHPSSARLCGLGRWCPRDGSGLVLLCLLALGTVSACTSSAGEPVRVALAELPCAELGEDEAYWASVPWLPVRFDEVTREEASGEPLECPWTLFGARDRIAMDHTLERVPRIVTPYISFEESGRRSTLASGDLAVILEASDRRVVIENATSERFYLRLVLE